MSAAGPFSMADMRHAFRSGRAEGRAIAARPGDGEFDMPPGILVTAVMAGLGAAASPWVTTAPFMIAMALLGGAFLAPALAAGLGRTAWRASLVRHWCGCAFDLGRIWAVCWRGAPHLAMRRIRAPDRIEERWTWIVANGWAGWITVVAEIALLWAGAA